MFLNIYFSTIQLQHNTAVAQFYRTVPTGVCRSLVHRFCAAHFFAYTSCATCTQQI